VHEFPSIPEPTENLRSLLTTVQRLKEVVEMITGQRDVKGKNAKGLAAHYSMKSEIEDLRRMVEELRRNI
jgi:hypothetical protein